MRSSPLRLLLIEENPADVLFLKDALQDGGSTPVSVTHVETLESARQALLNGSVDAAILYLGASRWSLARLLCPIQTV